MKKVFLVLMALALLAPSAIFANGQQSGGTANAAGYTGTLPYVEMDWYFGADPIGAPDWPMIQDALNAYIGTKLNMKLNMHLWPPQDWEQRMTVMVASGQDVGIIGFGSQSKLDYVIQSQRGSFYAIETLLEQYGKGTKALFNEGVWDAMKINGHIYGIPSLKDNCYIIPLIYNEEMAQKLGIDMTKAPTNGSDWYKLEPWLNDAIAKRDQVYGKLEEPLIGSTEIEMPYNFAIDNILNDSFLAVVNIPGIMDIKGFDEKTVFNLYATQEYRDFAHAQYRMVQKNILAYDYLDKPEWNPSGNMFAFVGWGYTYMPEHLNGPNYTTRMIDPSPSRLWTGTQNYYSSGTAISANCKNPDRAMMFLELVNNDPFVATLLRFGIEGTHWQRDAQGRMQLSGRNAENLTQKGYLLWYNAPVGNLTIVNAPESYSGPNNIMMTKMIQANKDAKLPTHMGFSLNIQPISNEIAACTNVVMEYRDTLRRGQAASEADVDRLINEFNTKLRANGIDRILAEAQRQADAFLAAKR